MGSTSQRIASVLRSAEETPLAEPVYWFLLTGNRSGIALAITLGFAVFFAGIVSLDGVPLVNSQPLFYAYGGLVAGNLTLITVIVSINQLFLSRQLKTPGELETQIENIIEYRAGIEHATGKVAPTTPLAFLRVLVEATRQTAQHLGGLAKSDAIRAGQGDIDGVVETLTEQMDEIDGALVGADPDTFRVLSVMLGKNYAQQIYELRVIRTEHEADIDEVAHDAIDDLIDRLNDLDVSRQYFRSIYLQEELSALSRVLLYAGLPSVAVSVGSLLLLTVPADTPTVVPLAVLLPATLTVGLVPLSILCSFFLRTATITKLTAATVPFRTPEDARL